MRKLKNILVGAWLSVGCVPMWSMHRLSPAPQTAEASRGTVCAAFLNRPDWCNIILFYQQSPDNFRSFFRAPFHPNIKTDKPFFETNLQLIVDELKKNGVPITEERWNELVQVLKYGLDEGQVQQDSVTSAGGGLPDDTISTITDLYNDMLDQITTFIVEGIASINVLSNGSYFTVECLFHRLGYEFNLPLKAAEKAASRVARAMSRFLADLERQQDEFTPSTIDPITQKICNKMARPRFVAKSPEQQTRILRRAIRMILIGRGYPAEESCRLASDIVDHWNQLKEQLDNDVTWTQDSDYHVKNVWSGRKLVKQEGKVRRFTTMPQGRLTQHFDITTPVQTQLRGPHTEYVKTSIRGGDPAAARVPVIRFIPAEKPFPYFLDNPTREELEAELEELEILSAEAEAKGDIYSVGVFTKRRQVVQKQLDEFYGFHVQLPTSFYTKFDETYRPTTASTKTGTSATAEVPGTNTDTSAEPYTPQRPRSSSLAVRYGLTLGYKF